MKIIKSKKQIIEEIKRLLDDSDNFECVDETTDGDVYSYFSKYITEETLIKFVEFLTGKNLNDT
jgi:hypothetical protein